MRGFFLKIVRNVHETNLQHFPNHLCGIMKLIQKVNFLYILIILQYTTVYCSLMKYKYIAVYKGKRRVTIYL